jgi:hypothetical protein
VSRAQRRALRDYTTALLQPRDRNKTLTALAEAEPIIGATHREVQRLQWFLSESPWEHEPINDRRIELRVPINHPVRSSRMSVLLQGSPESIMSADVERRDPGWVGAGIGKWSKRSCLPKSPVRPMLVIKDLELAQHLEKIVLVADQGPVQQLPPAGLDPALHDGVHPWHPDTALNDARIPAPAGTAPKAAVNVASRSPMRNVAALPTSRGSMTRLRPSWVTYCPGGCAVTPRTRTRPVACSMTVST